MNSNSKKRFKLLDSSDSENEGEKKGLGLNKDYAERYEKWRGKEEMQKLKDRYGENPEAYESSESESTSEEEWTTEHEKSFLTALSSLKGKSPQIYDSSRKFFKGSDAIEKVEVKAKKEKDKPFLIKDHERKMIMENRVDTESEDEEKARPPSYYEQQSQIKKDLKSVLKGFDSDAEDNSDLLKKRVKTELEIHKEEEDYRKWLKGELTRLDEKGKEEELKFLRDYWNDPKLDDGEQFLRDYVLQRKYLEEDDEDKSYIPTYDEVLHDSDEGGLSGDEKHVQEMDTFEHKFNFRFEEPDPEFIKKYPRTIEESYRRKETKRKQERLKAKERKEEEKEKRISEIQQLKALKRKEIMEKLEKLQEIAGTDDLPLKNFDLDADFNPEEYDRQMSAYFNQEYYQEKDNSKPVFPYEEEIDGDQEDFEIWVPSDDDEVDGEPEQPPEGGKRKKRKQKNTNGEGDKATKPSSSKPKASDTKSELLEISKGKRMGKKKSIFLEALERKKPKFDPSQHKSFEKYFEEYYKLDFEDFVGDTPCRFKYRKVVPNDFGLTTDEMLKADDKELNQWASLKKTYQFRTLEEENYEVQAYSKKATNPKKKKVLASVYGDRSTQDDDEVEDPVTLPVEKNVEVVVGDTPKRKKKKKKKKKSKVAIPEAEKVEPISIPDSNTVEGGTATKKRKRKRKSTDGPDIPTVTSPTMTRPGNGLAVGYMSKSHHKRKQGKVIEDKAVKRKAPGEGVSEDRLRAYGINPTKYEKRKKYAK